MIIFMQTKHNTVLVFSLSFSFRSECYLLTEYRMMYFRINDCFCQYRFYWRTEKIRSRNDTIRHIPNTDFRIVVKLYVYNVSYSIHQYNSRCDIIKEILPSLAKNKTKK